MTLFLHEMKRGGIPLLIWTWSVAFMLAVCVIIYPEMESQMTEITDAFANMGGFTAAFGMDQLNFGEFMGYFAVECGNTLGLGGALFAAILGVCALSGEERDRTAELLLTHPISRTRVVTEKLLSVLLRIVVFNLAIAGVVSIAAVAIGVEADAGKMALLFLSNFLLQLEVVGITFGISACLRSNGMGIGIGLALGLYFINILSNLTEKAEFLKYFTPFSFADGAAIVGGGSIEWKYLAVGAPLALACAAFAYWYYNKKEIY